MNVIWSGRNADLRIGGRGNYYKTERPRNQTMMTCWSLRNQANAPHLPALSPSVQIGRPISCSYVIGPHSGGCAGDHQEELVSQPSTHTSVGNSLLFFLLLLLLGNCFWLFSSSPLFFLSLLFGPSPLFVSYPVPLGSSKSVGKICNMSPLSLSSPSPSPLSFFLFK